MGKLTVSVAIAAALGCCWAAGAQAEDNLKVGLITTLSGPAAVLGQQARDGFRSRSRISAARWAAATSRSWWPTTNSSRMPP